MPNGKLGDNPLTDLIVYGRHVFPHDIEAFLIRIQELGRDLDRYPLGANWPYSPLEFDWEKGEGLDKARELLQHFISMLEAGRGDEVMLDPFTRRSIADSN